MFSHNPRHITLTHGELFLNHNVTIESLGRESTIDGNYSSRVFEISRGATVELDRLIIVNGNGKAQNPLGNIILDGDGGAILNEGSLFIQGSLVDGNGFTRNGAKNHALKAGGAIYNYHGDMVVVGCHVDDNFAGTGAGIDNDHGKVIMTDTTMTGNSASINGGAIYSVGGNAEIDLEIDHCTLIFNHAKRGGAVANFEGYVQFNSTDLEDNTASLVGGALFNFDGGMSVDPGCTLKDNHATKGGGAIYNLVGDLYVTDSNLVHNTTDGNGAGINSRAGTVSILDCHLDNNIVAGGVGGAIYAFMSKVSISESHLVNNSAFAGAAIYNQQSDMTVTDSFLVSNKASFFGGAIANFEGTVLVTGSQLIGNSAPVGAAIFNSLGTVKVGTSTFQMNTPDNIFGPFIDLGGNVGL
jgi:hypothetical protein